jgi:hypothetical protein
LHRIRDSRNIFEAQFQKSNQDSRLYQEDNVLALHVDGHRKIALEFVFEHIDIDSVSHSINTDVSVVSSCSFQKEKRGFVRDAIRCERLRPVHLSPLHDKPGERIGKRSYGGQRRQDICHSTRRGHKHDHRKSFWVRQGEFEFQHTFF